MQSIITSVITFILIGFLYKYLSKDNDDKIDKKQDLKLNIFFKYFGIFFISLGLIIALIPLFYLSEIDIVFMSVSMVILSIFFGSCGLYFFLEHKNHFVKITEHSITVSNCRGSITSINWHDITKVKFNALSGKVIIKDKLGNTIRINQFLKGINKLIDLMEIKTNINLTKLKGQVNAYSSRK